MSWLPRHSFITLPLCVNANMLRSRINAIVVATLAASTCFAQKVTFEPRVKPGHNPAKVERNDRLWKEAEIEVVTGKFGPANNPRYLDPPSGKLIHGSIAEKQIALTFDDGPHPIYTEALLEILKREKVEGTFFVVGKMVEKNPDLAQKIVKAGQEIANHTFSHVTLSDLSPREAEIEYQANNDAIYAATHVRPRFCRPPGGRYNDAVVKVAQQLGMTTVLWTDDPGDYKNIPANVLVQKTVSRLTNGGIVLLHSGVKQTIEILPMLIHLARARGFKIVSLHDLEESLHHRPVEASYLHR